MVIVDNIRINTSTQTLYIKTLILSREEISFQGRKIYLHSCDALLCLLSSGVVVVLRR